MSLLLDALKEAENRTRQGKPEPAQPGTAGGAEPHPRDTALTGSHLTLAEEAPAPAPARAAPPLHMPPPAAAPPAAARVDVPPTATRAAAAPATRSRWLQPAVLIALPLAAAALYVTMFRGDPEPLPALTPSRLQAPAALPDTAVPEAEGVAGPPQLQPLPPQPVSPAAASTTPTTPTPAADETRAFTIASERKAAAPAPAPARAELVIQGRASPIADAHAALRSGDLPRAERLYRDTLAGEPDQPDAHLGLALIEQSRGASSAALAHYRTIIDHRPGDPQAWAGLADLAGNAELEAMGSRLRTLIAAQPDPALHFALGNLLARQSRWPDAQESYFAAASGAPQNADYAFNLAVALDQLGKGRAAIPHYLRALTLAEGSRAVQFDAAAVRTRIARLEAAAP